MLKRMLGRLVDRFGVGVERALRPGFERMEARAQSSEATLARLEAQLDRLAGRLERLEALGGAATHLLACIAEEAASLAGGPGEGVCADMRGQMFSQIHEDGIIAGILARIGADTRVFLEIGAGDGVENTTRALLEIGWEGVWVESDPACVAAIRERFADDLSSGRLALIDDMVDRDNVAPLVARALTGRVPDVMSIDVDMNTSHLWRALDLRPRMCCIEYNACIPAPITWEVPYDPRARWDGTAFFGASLKRLEAIGRDRDMALIGCDLAGVNAFFVRADLAAQHFPGRYDAESHWRPPRFHLAYRRGHPAWRRAVGRDRPSS